MPTVHYGRLPEHSLLDLWKTERCKFFRERFQHRVHAHETEIAGSSFEASWSQYQKALQAAKEAMPEAPEGCTYATTFSTFEYPLLISKEKRKGHISDYQRSARALSRADCAKFAKLPDPSIQYKRGAVR